MEEIKTRLRAVEPEDVDFMMECESDRENQKWSDYRAPFSRNQLLTYALTYEADPFKAGSLRLIAENESGNPIGILDFYDISDKDAKTYLGICVHPSYRCKGFGSAILREGRRFAKERLGLRQLVAKVSMENKKALSMFGRNGFERVGLLPSWHRIGLEFHDFVLLACPTAADT